MHKLPVHAELPAPCTNGLFHACILAFPMQKLGAREPGADVAHSVASCGWK